VWDNHYFLTNRFHEIQLRASALTGDNFYGAKEPDLLAVSIFNGVGRISFAVYNCLSVKKIVVGRL
jgi:hypothetical protein